MYRVVLVDDDYLALADFKRAFPFGRMNFNVIAECMSAKEALPIIVENRPELVIADICLGDGDGLDIIAECLRKNVSSIFVIISGHDRFEYAQRAVTLGVFDYLLKPLSNDKTEDLLRRVALKLNSLPDQPALEDAQPDQFSQIITYVRSHVADHITLGMLESLFHLNATYISTLFTQRLGKNFISYRNDLRMEMAERLMRERKQRIQEIAEQVGIDDYRYFIRLFKQTYGVTPTQYIRNIDRRTKL